LLRLYESGRRYASLGGAFSSPVRGRIRGTVKHLEPDAIMALQRLPFRGNVRELKNLIER